MLRCTSDQIGNLMPPVWQEVKEMKILALLLTGMVLFSLTTEGWAQERVEQKHPPGMMPGRRGPDGGFQKDGGPMMGREAAHEGMMARILSNPELGSELGLSEEQVSRIQDSLEALRRKGDLLKKEMEASAMEQARLMSAETLDEAALMAAVERTGMVRTEIAKLRIRPLIMLRTVLTPEQVEKLTQQMQKHRGRPRESGTMPQDRRDAWKRMSERKGNGDSRLPEEDREPLRAEP